MKTYKEINEGKMPHDKWLSKLGLTSDDVVEVYDTPGTAIGIRIKDSDTVKKSFAHASKNIKGKVKKWKTEGGISTDGGRWPDIMFRWDSKLISAPKKL